MLRPFTEQDWEGRLREINLTPVVYYPGIPATDWTGTGRTVSSPPGLVSVAGGTWLDSTSYYNEHGHVEGTLATLLDGWWGEVRAAVPADGTAEISGTYTLQQPPWLPSDGVLAEFTKFNWTVPIEHMTSLMKVDQGKRIADLILRSVQAPDRTSEDHEHMIKEKRRLSWANAGEA